MIRFFFLTTIIIIWIFTFSIESYFYVFYKLENKGVAVIEKKKMFERFLKNNKFDNNAKKIQGIYFQHLMFN